ncbi:MAG: type II restriction endonuclease [Hyphomicrobiaceae bacterium]|nr:type II restriction endonuclease [Hyphomicrobiaceae bacterium]
MPLADVTDWMDEFGRPGAVWYAKRLAANDTLATNAHQAGPYIPKEFLFEIFPILERPDVENPDVWFNVYVDSHPDHQFVRAVWYNNKLRGGTRNETRLTNFGGASSALLDPDSTGALAVFAFMSSGDEAGRECHVWVCGGDGTEADLFEERLGPVEPKQPVVWKPGDPAPATDLFSAPSGPASCWLDADEIPAAWLEKFPTGLEIILKTIERRQLSGSSADVRLLKRRDCEFEIFRSVEQATWLPLIQQGFNTIDGFLGMASSILQSRKARSGRSLEYHAVEIFREDGLLEGSQFSHGPMIESGKRPDFLFPAVSAYENPDYPAEHLRMLAAKTTCKDRWRQILNEASRVPNKHLLTLQEGVSVNQFNEMTEAGVSLVVPAGLHKSYPEPIRPHLMTLEEFIGDVRLLPTANG